MTTQIDRHAATSSGADPAQIAIFQALKLGDLLCTTPALRAIRGRFPAAEITFIGQPWAQDIVARLFASCPSPVMRGSRSRLLMPPERPRAGHASTSPSRCMARGR